MGAQLVTVEIVVVEVLAAVAIRAEVVLRELLAQLGAVVKVDVEFLAKFVGTVGERTLIRKPHRPIGSDRETRSSCRFRFCTFFGSRPVWRLRARPSAQRSPSFRGSC